MVIKEKKQKNKDNKEEEEKKREVGWDLWCALKEEFLGYAVICCLAESQTQKLVHLTHYLTYTWLYFYISF